MNVSEFDPKRGLSFGRIVDLPGVLIWNAWTDPELLTPWLCPLNG
jgi:uncharacterized protein YndB with AHSA1/START domain